MGTVLAAFITNGSLEPCPYFEGYCGEHYPELEQKSGPRKVAFGMYFCMSLFDITDFGFLYTAHANDRHRTFHPLDYGAVRARKRAELDVTSAELSAAISARPRPPPSSTADTRVIRRRTTLTTNAIAGATDVDQIFGADAAASSKEARLLTTLIGGDGISSYDMQGLIEECGVCHMFYLGSILPIHIFSCSCDQTILFNSE
jgi:hypothetical protein